MAQRENIFFVPDSLPRVFGVSKWAVAGVFVLVGAIFMKLAMAEDAVYLRTLMPYQHTEAAPPQEVFAADDALDANDQHLLKLLARDDQEIVYKTVDDDQRWRVVSMRVTAYCPCAICCGKWADGITASNHRIQPGDVFVAADTMYRFRTEMIVPGYNYNQPVQVQDRGRVIKGNRLDVFFHTHETARRWGTRTLDVLVRAN